NKLKSAVETGLRADIEQLRATASLSDVLGVVEKLNQSDVHDGILVQTPPPDRMGADAGRQGFAVVRPDRDADGCHPSNVGLLMKGRATLAACTPSGVMELLER